MFLNEARVNQINEMRAELEVLQTELTDALHGRDDVKTNVAFDIGKLHEACHATEDALFNVLNVASSYLQEPVANEWIQLKKWKERQS